MNIHDVDYEDLLERIKTRNPKSLLDLSVAIGIILDKRVLCNNDQITNIIGILSELDEGIKKLAIGYRMLTGPLSKLAIPIVKRIIENQHASKPAVPIVISIVDQHANYYRSINHG
jgi:hypothetical protein